MRTQKQLEVTKRLVPYREDGTGKAAIMHSANSVSGACPYGCGNTLELIDNEVICIDANCPHPTAIHDLLINGGDHRHIVNIVPNPATDGFEVTIQHPLMERCAGELFSCGVKATQFFGLTPGTYYTDSDGGLL